MLTVVASLKGGSGKSTVTFNLAVWLAMAGIRVRAFDLDPQATLSDVIEVRQDEKTKPALSVEGGIAELLAAGSASAEGEEILVDVGTADIEAMNAAVSMADRVLVPVQPSQADIWSVQRFLRMVRKEGQDQGPDVYAFINRGDTHHAVRESDEAAAALVTLPGLRLLRPRLRQRTAFRRSFSEGQAVFELEPRGKAARELLALAAATYAHVLK